jgi:phosphate transport system protein
MSQIAREMLRDSLDAFDAGDAAKARKVIERDDEIDRLYNLSFHGLLNDMSQEPDAAGRKARLLMVAKHLERIGDYVTDICEQVVYMKEALVIKHSR